jgi:chromosome segregation ATPase
MSDNSWVLHGIDAEARQAALAEAERRGLSLSDYLTEIVLSEVAAQQDDDDAPEAGDDTLPLENAVLSHRVAPLERQLTSALGGLDGALRALDDNIVTLSDQVGRTDLKAEGAAAALADLRAEATTLRERLAEAERAARTLADHNDVAHDGLATRCAELEAHLASVEAIAYAADSAGAKLSAAYDALQRALAQDFNEFAHETDRRIAASAEDLRAHAADAADRADAAAHRAIETLRQARQAMEEGLADQAAETRAVVHSAFADAAERIDALADRVRDNQRIAQRMGEQMNARLNNIEDAAHVSIEETADSLRLADAAIAAALARAEQDQRAALADLSTRQDTTAQRLDLVDAALQTTMADLGVICEGAQAALADVETVAATRQDALEAKVHAHLADVMARLDLVADAAAHDDQIAAANIDRVEACTMAALEKLAGDIAVGDAALAERADAEFTRLEAHFGLTQENHAQTLARLDKGLGANNRAAAELSARLVRLEGAVNDAATQKTISALSEDVSARLGVLERAASDTRTDAETQLASLREQLAAHEGQINGTAQQAQSIARMLSRVTAQSADAAADTETRLHKMELAQASMRLELGATVSHDTVTAIAARIEAMEQAQNAALEALREDIARFVSDNDERLAALEQGGATALSGDEILIAHAIEARLTELEQRDVAAEFETLRRRIDDRILSVESRSVRALEQMAETVSLIEKRYIDGEDDLAHSA